MKRASTLFLSALTFSALPALCQAPAGQSLTCSVRPPAPASDASRAFNAGDFANAQTLYAASIAAKPSVLDYEGLVHSQLEANQLPEALASANAAIAALPASAADMQALLGDVLLRSGKIPEASAAYTKALGIDRCSARAHFGFARVNDLVGRHLTAQKEFNFAHRLALSDPAITAAFLVTIPAPQRLAPLRTLLASHPALPPAQLQRLNDEVAVLDQHLACTPTAPITTEKLDLAQLYLTGRYVRSWGLKTRVNDTALQALELDSTADGIVLSADDAAKAHVHPLTTAPTSPDATYKAVADEIKIGNLTFKGCPVTVVPNKVVDAHNSLIGTIFFRDHLIHIDYVAMTLSLSPLPNPGTNADAVADQFIAPSEKDWSPVYVAGPNVLLPTLINKNGPYLFAIDTGNLNSILSPAVTQKELTGSKDATLNLQGYSGEIVKVIPRDGGGAAVTAVTDIHGPTGALLRVSRPVKLPVLRFTNNEIPEDTAVSFDISPLSHAAGVEVSALLGFQSLSYYSLDLNYRDCLARIQFDINRRYHVRANEQGNEVRALIQ